jgi:hypothetical protein
MLSILQKHASGDGMKTILHPWQILLLVLAGWINRQQQKSIEYLIAENQILREKLGKKRILLNDDQRRRLAIKERLWEGRRWPKFAALSRRKQFFAGTGN